MLHLNESSKRQLGLESAKCMQSLRGAVIFLYYFFALQGTCNSTGLGNPHSLLKRCSALHLCTFSFGMCVLLHPLPLRASWSSSTGCTASCHQAVRTCRPGTQQLCSTVTRTLYTGASRVSSLSACLQGARRTLLSRRNSQCTFHTATQAVQKSAEAYTLSCPEDVPGWDAKACALVIILPGAYMQTSDFRSLITALQVA